MHGCHNKSTYYQNPTANTSFDPFSSPSRYYDYSNHQQSVDVFAETPKRRSSGESIARSIRNALDPEYGYPQPSMDVFCPSSSPGYEDDASILAAVSSTHSSQCSSAPSSQEPSSSQTLISNLFQKSKKKEKLKPASQNRYVSIFHKASRVADDDETMEDFLSPDQIEQNRKRYRKSRPKQIRMDDYIFKARRVDKGAREFGLHTTHEPKRGSKKKRESIEMLEVEKADFEKQKQMKHEKYIDERKTEVDNLDFSLAFGTPSPVRNKPKISRLSQFFGKDNSKSSTILKQERSDNNIESKISSFSSSDSQSVSKSQNFKSSISFNDPTTYANDSFFEATVCSTPEKSILAETMPMESCNLAAKQTTPKRNVNMTNSIGKSRVKLIQPNPIKRREFSFGSTNQDQHPISQPKRQKIINNKKEPEFDYSSSPITLNDEDDFKIKMEPPKRQALRDEEEQRIKFGNQVTDREKIMKQLVDQKFRDDRENGCIEKRREELKDGQVIRNKEMRRNLMHGAACPCCRKYYDGLGMEEQEKKEYINKISRHRYVHQALPDTPDRYWDLTLGPRDDEEAPKVLTQKRNWESSLESKRRFDKNAGIQNWNNK